MDSTMACLESATTRERDRMQPFFEPIGASVDADARAHAARGNPPRETARTPLRRARDDDGDDDDDGVGAGIGSVNTDMRPMDHTQARRPRRRGACSCQFASFVSVVWILCAAFAAYIVLQFFAQPVKDWITVQDFSQRGRPVPIAVHWAGGMVVLVVGPLQLLPQIRASRVWRRAVHVWAGRLYVVAAVATCIAGLAYTALNSTVGGASMDATFVVYGVLFLVCAVMAFVRARQRRFASHAEWAMRTFALGTGSAFYRILVGPLFVAHIPDSELPRHDKLLWLTVAAWLFWPPPMLAAEWYIRSRMRPVMADELQKRLDAREAASAAGAAA